MWTHMIVDMPCGQAIFSPELPRHKKKCLVCQATSEVAGRTLTTSCSLSSPELPHPWHATHYERCIDQVTQPKARTEALAAKSLLQKPMIPSAATQSAAGSAQSPFEQALAAVKGTFDKAVESNDNDKLFELLFSINGLEASMPEIKETASFILKLFMSHIERMMLNHASDRQLNTVCFALHALVNSPDGLPVIRVLFQEMDQLIWGMSKTQSMTPTQLDSLQRSLQVLNNYFLEDPIWAKKSVSVDRKQLSIPQLVKTWIELLPIPQQALEIGTEQVAELVSQESISQEEVEEACEFLNNIFEERPSIAKTQRSSLLDLQQLVAYALKPKTDRKANFPINPIQMNDALSLVLALSIDDLQQCTSPLTVPGAAREKTVFPSSQKIAQEELERVRRHLDDMLIQVDSSPSLALGSSICELQKLIKYPVEETSLVVPTIPGAALSSVLEVPGTPSAYQPSAGATEAEITNEISAGITEALKTQNIEQLAYWINTMGTGSSLSINKKSVRAELLDWMQRILWQQEKHAFQKLRTLMKALNLFNIKSEHNQTLLMYYFRRLNNNLCLSIQEKAGPFEKARLRESLLNMRALIDMEPQTFSGIKQTIYDLISTLQSELDPR